MWRKTVGKNKLSILKTVVAIEFPEMEFNMRTLPSNSETPSKKQRTDSLIILIGT
jgi:hypothetical protein